MNNDNNNTAQAASAAEVADLWKEFDRAVDACDRKFEDAYWTAYQTRKRELKELHEVARATMRDMATGLRRVPAKPKPVAANILALLKQLASGAAATTAHLDLACRHADTSFREDNQVYFCHGCGGWAAAATTTDQDVAGLPHSGEAFSAPAELVWMTPSAYTKLHEPEPVVVEHAHVSLVDA